MKQKSEKEAFLTLATLCARAEHCQYEMIEKLQKWEIPDEEQARIMQRLVEERYVDDERYARAFVMDKIRYNKWGRRKVDQALWAKHIDEQIRQQVLDEVDEEEYIAVLRPLLKQKRKSVRARNDYEMYCKLVQYAAGKGFTMDIIRQCLEEDDEDFEVE